MLPRFGRLLFRMTHWSLRGALWTVAAVLLLGVTTVAGVRYGLLPRLDSLRPGLESRLSRDLGRTVHLGAIHGDWDGGRVLVTVAGLRVDDRHQHALLQVATLRGSLSWWSLAVGEVRFRELQISGVSAQLNRNGQLWLLGDLPINAPGKAAASGDLSAVNWLLRQYDIDIKDARLDVHDVHNAALALSLQDIRLAYRRNFLAQNLVSQWRLAGVPGQPWQIIANWAGLNAEHWRDWQGDARLDMVALPLPVVAAWWPQPGWTASGTVDSHAQLWLEQGRLQRSNGWVALHGVQLTPDTAAGLRIRDGYVAVDEHFSRHEGYQAELQQLRLALGDQPPLTLPTLQISYQPASAKEPAQGRLSVGAADIAALTAFSRGWPQSGPWSVPLVDYLNRAKAQGQLLSAAYQWTGPLSSAWAADAWAAHGQVSAALNFSHLAVVPVDGLPGWRALNAQLTLGNGQARIKLDSPDLHIDCPGLCRQPLALGQVQTSVQVQRPGAEWQLTVPSLAIHGNDINGDLSGSYVHTAAGGNIDMHGHISHLHMPAITRYLPKSLPADLLSWFDHAFAAGEAVDGDLLMHGPVSQFPFADGKSGQFRFTSRVQGAHLHYADGWPEIDGIVGRLRFEGHTMQFLAEHGSLSGTQLGATRVDIPDLETGELLTVNGKVRGSAADFVDYINQSPLRKPLAGAFNRLHLGGDGNLDLQLQVPLQHSDDTRVVGAYTFHHAVVQGGGDIPVLSDVQGVLHFTERSVSLNQATAQALGGKAVISVSTSPKGAITVEANGNADIGLAARFYQLPLAARVRGSSDYRLVLGLDGDNNSMLLQSNLEGVDIDLPEPLGKRAADGRALRIKSRALDANRDSWLIVYQQRLAANLTVVTDSAGHAALLNGEIRVGSTDVSEPSRPGVWISGHLARLRVEDWQPFWGSGGSADGGASSGGSQLGLDLSIDSLQWQGRSWPNVAVTVAQQGGHWQGQLHSPMTSGSFDISGGAHPVINAKLDTLAWNSDAEVAAVSASGNRVAQPNLAQWPELVLSVSKLMHNQRDLGQLDVHGLPETGGYRIESLQLSNSDGKAVLHGDVQGVSAGYALTAQLELNFSNAGQLATRWGYDKLLRKGQGRIVADVSANCVGLLPDWSTLHGRIQLDDIKNGVFLKVEPGISRLLGLFSVQEWMRRIRFDLSDVFAEGLAFDRLSAVANIGQGQMVVSNFVLVSPSLTMSAAGTVNLNTQAVDGQLKVIPAVGGGLSVATALINPMVGLLTLVAQQILNNPFGKVLAYTYKVGGTLDEPKLNSQGAP